MKWETGDPLVSSLLGSAAGRLGPAVDGAASAPESLLWKEAERTCEPALLKPTPQTSPLPCALPGHQAEQPPVRPRRAQGSQPPGHVHPGGAIEDPGNPSDLAMGGH